MSFLEKESDTRYVVILSLLQLLFLSMLTSDIYIFFFGQYVFIDFNLEKIIPYLLSGKILIPIIIYFILWLSFYPVLYYLLRFSIYIPISKYFEKSIRNFFKGTSKVQLYKGLIDQVFFSKFFVTRILSVLAILKVSSHNRLMKGSNFQEMMKLIKTMKKRSDEVTLTLHEAFVFSILILLIYNGNLSDVINNNLFTTLINAIFSGLAFFTFLSGIIFQFIARNIYGIDKWFKIFKRKTEYYIDRRKEVLDPQEKVNVTV